MPTVLIGGGTGLIGSRLSERLEKKGYGVLHLSRRANPNGRFPAAHWDIETGTIDPEAVRQADYVINLAGAGIADKPWTEARKELIIESRTRTTALLRKSFTNNGHHPQAFVSSAAIGFYGDRGDTLLTEEAQPGTGFLSESCVAWEKAIREVALTGVRTVGIRIGVVLSTQGGALEKMLLPLKVGVSTYFASGSQWYSWIHLDDLCDLFIHALENSALAGFYNGVAPNPVRNKALAKMLLRASGKKGLVLPAPTFALRVAMGEMADVVLQSTRVSSEKTQRTGFQFQYPELEPALQDLLQRRI